MEDANNRFDHGEDTMERGDSPEKRVLEFPGDFQSVYEETIGVKDWFTLGSLLEVEPSLLKIIGKNSGDNQERLEQMLVAWLGSGNATWLSLFHALRTMGLSTASDKLDQTELQSKVHSQQISLDQKAAQSVVTEGEVDEAEDELRLLKTKLTELQDYFENVTWESSKLVKKPKDLELDLIMKEKRKARLERQKSLMTKTQLVMVVVDDIQGYIDEVELNIKDLGRKIEAQNKEKKRLNEKIANKLRQIEERKIDIQESRENFSELEAQLDAETRVFDLQRVLQLQCSRKIQEELTAQIEQLKLELNEKDEPKFDEVLVGLVADEIRRHLQQQQSRQH